MRLYLQCLGALAIVIATPAESQDAIYLHATADDVVGSRLALNLREKIGGSYTFTAASTSDYPRWNLDLVTLDPDSDNSDRRLRTIYSAILSLELKDDPAWYMANWVGTCGSTVVAQCAETILAGVSDHIAKFRQAIGG